MKNSKIIYVVLVVVIIGLAVFYLKVKKVPEAVSPEAPASLAGCYVATLAKDVYTLNIISENNGAVAGTLAYKNFEKDSSAGNLEATYKDSTLLGDYSFFSEGMSSVRQVIFKKTDAGFVQGFGPVTVEGDREHFTDLSQVTFDQSPVFKATPCTKVPN